MKLTYRTTQNAVATSKIVGKPLDMPEWWKVEASTDEAEEILIYDYIGWPFNDPYDLTMHLKKLNGKDVKFKINSPGGDVFDGLAIYSAMQDYPGKITTVVESLAASMASVLAIGGAKTEAKKHAMFMIHEPLALAVGNQHLHRDVADILGKINANFVDIYSGKVGGKKRDLKDKLEAETWFTAKEAKEYGLVDAVIDGESVKAAFDLSIFANVPDEYRAYGEGRELTRKETERALRQAGAHRDFARKTAAKGAAQSDIELAIELTKLNQTFARRA